MKLKREPRLPELIEELNLAQLAHANLDDQKRGPAPSGSRRGATAAVTRASGKSV